MNKRTRRWLALGLLVAAPLGAEIRSLTILHTNDLHARLTPLENQQGGFAYVATAIEREREHCTDCILLNAGDLVQGTPVSTIYHGLPSLRLPIYSTSTPPPWETTSSITAGRRSASLCKWRTIPWFRPIWWARMGSSSRRNPT